MTYLIVILILAVLVGYAMISDASDAKALASSKQSSSDALNRLYEDEQIRLDDLSSKPLEALTAPIPLKRGESCYYAADVALLENRKVRVGTGFAGPTVSIPIVRSLGLRFRAGYLAHTPTVADKLTPIDGGMLYITNRELVFIGKTSSKTIRLSELVQVNIAALPPKMALGCSIPFYVTLTRRKGKIIFIAAHHPAEILATLARLSNVCDHLFEPNPPRALQSPSTEV